MALTALSAMTGLSWQIWQAPAALDFSGLPNLPASQRAAVETAATAAAEGQAYSAQDVVNEIAQTNWFDFLPVSDNLLTVASAAAAVGELVESIRSVTSDRTITLLTIGDGALKTATGITISGDRYEGLADRGPNMTFVLIGSNMTHSAQQRIFSLSASSITLPSRGFWIDANGRLLYEQYNLGPDVRSSGGITAATRIISFDVDVDSIDFRIDQAINSTGTTIPVSSSDTTSVGYFGSRLDINLDLSFLDAHGWFYAASDVNVEIIERFANEYYSLGL